jgi:hypothetical protein
MTEAVGRVEVARVEAEHLPALAEFYRCVWNPNATVDSVRAGRAEAATGNPVTPGLPPPTWLLLQDGRAIAHVTTIPAPVWLDGREHPAHWIKGLWVLPEFQRSSAGFLVLRAAVAALPSAMALVHEPAAIRLFQALGFTDLGGLPNALRVLDAGALLRRLDLQRLGLQGLPRWVLPAVRVARPAAPILGPLLGAATRTWAAVASGRLSGVTIRVATACDSESVETLWVAVRSDLRAGPARGGTQLARRYTRGDEYRFVEVRSGPRLVGLGIVRRPRPEGDERLHGIRIATLSDLLYRPSEPRVGLAVLRGAERAAGTMGADALLCGASNAALQPLLRRRCYLPLPSNLRVLARFVEPGRAVPERLSEWWVTRGDSEGDGSF